MRLLKFCLLQLFALFIFVSLLQSCNSDQPVGTYQNDKISSGIRNKIHKLNDKFFAAAKDNNILDVEDLLAKEMLENNDYKRTVEMISNESKSGKYTILDEFYINSTRPGHNNDIIPAGGVYKIGYHATTSESYISFIVVQNGEDKWLITAIYGKYDYGWKINELHFGHYSINGKTAPELLQLAKQEHAKDYLVDALNNMELAAKCLRPSEIWEYVQEKQMTDYYSTLSNEAYERFKFPIVIPVPTKPQIFRIMTQTQPGGGYVPTIKYVTTVNVKDTVALKTEFEAIKKIIGKVLPGVDQDKKLIIFSAYNERPAGDTNPFSFDMMDVLK